MGWSYLGGCSEETEGVMRGAPRNDLTSREDEILVLLRQGMKNSEIAANAGCAMGTVKIHIKNISRKLGRNPREHEQKVVRLRRLYGLRAEVNGEIAQLETELNATYHE